MQTIQDVLLDRGSKFLQTPEVMAKLPAQMQADIQSGKKEFYLADVRFRRSITGAGGGILDLVKPGDKRQIGISSVDGGVLEKDTVMAVVALGISYGHTATVGVVDASLVRYSSSEYLATLPTGLVNSEVKFYAGDKKVLECATKKFFANALAEIGSEANQENELILPQPKLITDGKVLKTSIHYPDAIAAFAAGSHFLEVRWTGVFIGERTN